MADSNITPLKTGIPLGRGRGAKEKYHFGNFLFYVKKDGTNINPWSTGEWVDPKLDPQYDHTEALGFEVGKVADLPSWDSDFIREMLAVEDFAKPGQLDAVTKYIASGLESYDLIEKVRADGNLVTLKDFGLDDAPAKDEQLGG